ncbi:MAG: glycosyltransferase family 2 protein [Spirochaetes bacterium]|nr:glycosyltransferase family 2 protein [Spirochaetota bacterium]
MTIFFIILSVGGIILLLSIYSVSMYRNLTFHKFKVDKNYHPKAVIFAPCKGNSSFLKQNLESIVHQKYAGTYHVHFILDFQEDSAYPVIKEILDSYPYTSLTIAGQAKNNGQKNHNILQALKDIEKKGNDYEVYTFYDSDHSASPEWLAMLVQTLTIKDTEISTFRALIEKDDEITAGNILYSMLTNYMYSVNTFTNQVWGGSMGIRKTTFEKYDIKKIWEESISHDCPINGLKAKRIFNPDGLPEENTYHYDFPGFMTWIIRNITNWRFFSKEFWNLSFYSISANLLMFIFFVISLIFIPFFPESQTYAMILGSYVVVSYFIVAVFLTFRMKKKIKWFFIYYFFLPIFLFSTEIGFVASIFNKTIHWAGKKYTINNKGAVLKIE